MRVAKHYGHYGVLSGLDGKAKIHHGFAKALGIEGSVQSPTYVLMKSYPIAWGKFRNFIHIDAYRLETPEEFHTLKPEPVFPYPTRLTQAALFPEISNVQKNSSSPLHAATPSRKIKVIHSELPNDNRLVIPKIGVNVEIVEGKDERALNRGIWHLPDTSTPDKGGNTVLTGHRFQYLAGQRTLYLLDQMRVNDVIIVYWRGKEYDYRVVRRKIVNPDAVNILYDTPNPQLTIFTCTPVFSTKQRLVLFAEPLIT